MIDNRLESKLILNILRNYFLFHTNIFMQCMGTEDIWSRDRIVEVTKKAYLTKNFKVLEELSNKFRNEKSKILSGTWNLTIFIVQYIVPC